MHTIRSATYFYPSFHLGCKPAAIKCELSIVEANGNRVGELSIEP